LLAARERHAVHRYANGRRPHREKRQRAVDEHHAQYRLVAGAHPDQRADGGTSRHFELEQPRRVPIEGQQKDGEVEQGDRVAVGHQQIERKDARHGEPCDNPHTPALLCGGSLPRLPSRRHGRMVPDEGHPSMPDGRLVRILNSRRPGPRFRASGGLIPAASSATGAEISRPGGSDCSMAHETILVVDDEQLLRRTMARRLRTAGYDVLEAADGRQALELAADGVDLVVLDYRLPDLDGLSVLKELKQRAPDTLVILLTAYASIDAAVTAMKLGAYHFANKPLDLEALVAMVEQALETTRLRREVRQLRASQAQPYSLEQIVGSSPAMTSLKAMIQEIAASPASTVLLLGESGSGKDLVAKVLHYTSARASRPFVNITCSALPETLLESELFGYERGA